jgi:hypothetical protein
MTLSRSYWNAVTRCIGSSKTRFIQPCTTAQTMLVVPPRNSTSSSTASPLNDNIATHRWENLQLLPNKLLQIKAETLDCTVVNLCNSQDGFFANAAGVKEYFRDFTMVDIALITLQGHDKWAEYSMAEILVAIDNVGTGNVFDTPCHRIVEDWIKLSPCKEQ